MTVRLVSNEKIAETSSKGNQEKWFDHGRWYKLDQFGYEALTETFTSMILERSNIEQDTPFRSAVVPKILRGTTALCRHPGAMRTPSSSLILWTNMA